MPNGHEMLTPDDSPGAEAPFRGPFEGEIWYNKNLAATFREVAAIGKDGYYKGRIGKEIVKVLAAMGGVMTEEDLANHYVRNARLITRWQMSSLIAKLGPGSSCHHFERQRE